ncbi:MAG: DJ-1/PfpI family protein [Gemmataceae bacterium]|jgi:protease I|nr:DJ-1/PfpI family protein [Gemmataceae bacterium]
MNSPNKILLVIGDAAEVLDTFYPLFRLQEEGYCVQIAGPQSRVYHLVQHDRHPDWDITVESPGYKLKADIAFKDVNVNEYIGLIISGGRAPEYLRYDADLIRITKEFNQSKKPIASICHGIEILAAADIIRSREVTTVAKCRFDAEFSGGIYLNQEVVVNENLVCARTWHDNPAWMREFVRLVNSQAGKAPK